MNTTNMEENHSSPDANPSARPGTGPGHHANHLEKAAHLQGISELFDAAWATYKATFVKLIRVNWIPVILGIVTASVFAYVSDLTKTHGALQMIDAIDTFAVIFGFTIVTVAMSLLVSVAQVKTLEASVGTHHLHADHDAHHSHEHSHRHDHAAEHHDAAFSILDIYKKSAPMISSFLFVSILVFVADFAGLMLLIVPGIVFSVWFSFAPMICILEGGKGVHALKKSKEYVRGIWAEVFARFVGIFAFMFLLGIATGVFVRFLSLFFPAALHADFFINALYQLVGAPFFLVYVYELYKDVLKVNIS